MTDRFINITLLQLHLRAVNMDYSPIQCECTLIENHINETANWSIWFTWPIERNQTSNPPWEQYVCPWTCQRTSPWKLIGLNHVRHWMLIATSDFENCRTQSLFVVLILHICCLCLDSGKLFFEEYYKRKKKPPGMRVNTTNFRWWRLFSWSSLYYILRWN